jgi:outer membrane protein assembly factor BamB
MKPLLLPLFIILCASTSPREINAANWPQGPGPNYTLTTADAGSTPTSWSAARDENVAWRTTLPETGQSALTIWNDRVFLNTFQPVDADAEIGSDTTTWCLSAKDGSVLWKHDIPGGYQTKLSAPFGDASAPAPVTDGKHLWVLNPTGRLVCLDLDGNPLWEKETTSVSRTQPVLFDGKLIFHRQVYLPDDHGHFTHDNAKASREKWTQLQALDAATGDQVWLSECGVNMGCQPLIQHLDDGTPVLVVGRGGGHGPPETPDGVSMIRADNGETLWTLELPQFASTQTYPVIDNQALIFHKGDHLWVDAKTGKITKQVSIVKDIPVRRWTESGRETITETLDEKKPRSITQQSNLLVGDHHYFRAYTRNYLGRVNTKTGAVEYLELPLQVLREPGQPDDILWNESHRPDDLASANGKKKAPGLTMTSLRLNEVKNARGHTVMGDARAQANGWGHTASPLPTAFGNHLIVPLLSGIVFVIQADAPTLDETAVLSINDLGPLGQSFTRAALTTDSKKIYAHTIKEALAFSTQ